MSVNVAVLYFVGCPSWQTAIERVHAAADRTGVSVQVSMQAVESTEDADRLRFTGSPTILLDGTDAFAQPGDIPALACRVYTTPDGLAGSPTSCDSGRRGPGRSRARLAVLMVVLRQDRVPHLTDGISADDQATMGKLFLTLA